MADMPWPQWMTNEDLQARIKACERELESVTLAEARAKRSQDYLRGHLEKLRAEEARRKEMYGK